MVENFKILYGERELVPRGTSEGKQMTTLKDLELWIQQINEAQGYLRTSQGLTGPINEGLRASIALRQEEDASGTHFVWTASLGTIEAEADSADRAMANATKQFLERLGRQVEETKRTQAALLQVIQGLQIKPTATAG